MTDLIADILFIQTTFFNPYNILKIKEFSLKSDAKKAVCMGIERLRVVCAVECALTGYCSVNMVRSMCKILFCFTGPVVAIVPFENEEEV